MFLDNPYLSFLSSSPPTQPSTSTLGDDEMYFEDRWGYEEELTFEIVGKVDERKLKDIGERDDAFKDETLTIATSDFTAPDEGFDKEFKVHNMVRKLYKHPQERRKVSQRISSCILIGFLGIMLLTLIIMTTDKSTNSGNTTTTTGASPTDTDVEKNHKLVNCAKGKSMSFSEWLNQDLDESRSLCDPEFYSPSSLHTFFEDHNIMKKTNKPAKVFILLGEGNMVGKGQIYGKDEGTLEYAVHTKKRFTHLVDFNSDWRINSKVRFVGVHNDGFDVYRNEWLGVHDRTSFGPELQFGYIMGEVLDDGEDTDDASSPILIIKSASERQDLGGYLLPPGSHSYQHGDFTYAGYGGSPRRWKTGKQKDASRFRAGIQYDTVVTNVKAILNDIRTYSPESSNSEYTIEGFVWWHGDSDRRMSAYADRYEKNLVSLIESLRYDLQAPQAKFVVATLGQDGENMEGDTLRVTEAQMAMGNNKKYSQFEGNVAVADIRSSWRGAHLPGHSGNDKKSDDAHYGRNAETVMEVGNAVGLAMAKLLLEGRDE